MSVARVEEAAKPRAQPLRPVGTPTPAAGSRSAEHKSLQRSKGNQAVVAMVQRRAAEPAPNIPPAAPVLTELFNRAGVSVPGAPPAAPPAAPAEPAAPAQTAGAPDAALAAPSPPGASHAAPATPAAALSEGSVAAPGAPALPEVTHTPPAASGARAGPGPSTDLAEEPQAPPAPPGRPDPAHEPAAAPATDAHGPQVGVGHPPAGAPASGEFAERAVGSGVGAAPAALAGVPHAPALPAPGPVGAPAARAASPHIPGTPVARLAPPPPPRPARPGPATGVPAGLRTGGRGPGAGPATAAAGGGAGPAPQLGAAGGAALAGGAAGAAPAGGAGNRAGAADRAAVLAARPAGPAADPAFRAAHATVAGVAAAQAAHPPVAAAVGAAHAAAVPPGNDVEAQAKQAKAGDMAAAKVEDFDRKKFVDQVLAKVNELTPSKADEVDEFKKDNKAGAIKQAVKGDVAPAAKQSAGDVKSETEKAPDPSKATPKEVTPLEQPNVPAPPANAGAAAATAMPPPLPPAATDLSAGPKQVEAKMADAKITDEQLKKGKEPKFDKAVESKTTLGEHAAKAPQEVRADEKAKLDAAKAAAASSTQAGMTAMHGAAQAKQADGHGKKETAKQKDEKTRKEVADEINGVFEAAKTKVELTLSNLDTAVNETFDRGAQAAATAFENDVERRKEQIKSAMPWDEWLSSMIWEPSPELKKAYTEGRAAYLVRMEGVIGDVATVVDTHLRDAKQTIAKAQADIAAIVARQPAHLREVAREAAAGLTEKFTELTAAVKDKEKEVVETVAGKYVEARKGIDEKIKEMEEADKGLLDMALDDLNAVIETILKLKEMLTSMIARAAGIMDRIIADPIAFLEKLINAVKVGFTNFGKNILAHLKTGFYEWILGPIKEMGVEIPTEWNLQSIFKLVLQVVGVTWEQIKGKIIAKLPPPVAQILEGGIEAIAAYQKGGAGGVAQLAMDKLPPQVKSVIEMVNRIRTGGIAELWKIVAEKIGDLKRMVIDKIKDFLVEKVIKAGISWVLSLCNPAGAFVKAVELIIKIVSFFVDNAAKIKAVVDKILDSMEDILDGGGKVAGMIEETLAKFIPMVIEFVASLLGFGGIGAKVQEIIKSVRGTIDKAIDWVIDKIFAALKWVWEKIKAGARAVRNKLAGEPKAPAAPPSPEPAPALADPDVAKKAVDRVVSSAPESPEELKRTVAVVEDELRPHGLGSIRLAADPTTLEVTFEADSVGSPAPAQRMAVQRQASVQRITNTPGVGGANERRAVAWKEVFRGRTAEAKRLRDALSEQGQSTTAALVVDGRLIGRKDSKGGRHAEEVIEEGGVWARGLAAAEKIVAKGGVPTLSLAINRAPCGWCATVLERLGHEVQAHPVLAGKINLVLLPTGTYEPTEPMKDDEREAELALVNAVHEAAGESGVKEMKTKYRLSPRDPGGKPVLGRTELLGTVGTANGLRRIAAAGWDIAQLNMPSADPERSQAVELAEFLARLARELQRT